MKPLPGSNLTYAYASIWIQTCTSCELQVPELYYVICSFLLTLRFRFVQIMPFG